MLWSIRSRFHFVADTHNPYKKFLLSSYKGIKQAVRHQSDGSPEDAIPLDKRYDITTQDILWNLHHLVVYQHYIAGQRYETAFQSYWVNIRNIDSKSMNIPGLAGWAFAENIKSTFHLYFFCKKEQMLEDGCSCSIRIRHKKLKVRLPWTTDVATTTVITIFLISFIKDFLLLGFIGVLDSFIYILNNSACISSHSQ